MTSWCRPCKAQPMELDLKDKTALITGGSRGIGLGIAARFLEAGANVMISSRTAEDLAEAAAGLVAEGAPRGAGGLGGGPRGPSRGRPGVRGRDRGPIRRDRHPGQQRRHQPLLRSDDRHRRGPGPEDVRGQPTLGAGLDGGRREGRAPRLGHQRVFHRWAWAWSRTSVGTTSPRPPCCTSRSSSPTSWLPTSGSTLWHPGW